MRFGFKRVAFPSFVEVTRSSNALLIDYFFPCRNRYRLQPVEKSKNMKKAHFLSNADTAINFLRTKQV